MHTNTNTRPVRRKPRPDDATQQRTVMLTDADVLPRRNSKPQPHGAVLTCQPDENGDIIS